TKGRHPRPVSGWLCCNSREGMRRIYLGFSALSQVSATNPPNAHKEGGFAPASLTCGLTALPRLPSGAAIPGRKEEWHVQTGVRQQRFSDDGHDRGDLLVLAEGRRRDDRPAAQPSRQALARLAGRSPQPQGPRNGDPE